MKKCVTTFAAIAFAGAISATAFAGPVGRFDNGYLDEHPEVAHQLGANPALADNPVNLSVRGVSNRCAKSCPWIGTNVIVGFSTVPAVNGPAWNVPDSFVVPGVAREGVTKLFHNWVH
jgi:hypothetical protein